MMILLRDLPKEFLKKRFGEEMGGQGDPDPLVEKLGKPKEILGNPLKD